MLKMSVVHFDRQKLKEYCRHTESCDLLQLRARKMVCFDHPKKPKEFLQVARYLETKKEPILRMLALCQFG